MPLIELSTALIAAGSSVAVPFANKVLEKSAQRLGGHVDEHLAALFTRAYGYLAATGREPQSVEAKIAIPLLQAASLESDPTLADLWAALLANAADPAQQAAVQPGFAEVLRQLTPTHAVILAHLYKHARIDEKNLPYYELERISTQRMPSELGMTDRQFAEGVDNLLRLRLCAPPTPRAAKGGSIGGPSAPTLQVCPTVFGVAFLAAVTPPTP